MDRRVIPDYLSSQVLYFGIELSDLLLRACQLFTQSFQLVLHNLLLLIDLGCLFNLPLPVCVELFDHLVDILSDEADGLAQRVGTLTQSLYAVAHEFNLV